MSSRILQVGKKVLIRTVTNYFTGQIVAIEDGFVVLEQAAWIAYTGRFATALLNGSFDEIEPYPGGVEVAIGSIVDVSPWGHELPREQK